jgi:hypothetical protein
LNFHLVDYRYDDVVQKKCDYSLDLDSSKINKNNSSLN